MSFMISRETENIQSLAEVESAFRAITANGDKPYVTKDEIFQVKSSVATIHIDAFTSLSLSFSPSLQSLSQAQAEYCVKRMKPYKGLDGRTIPGALDYKDFAEALFGT